MVRNVALDCIQDIQIGEVVEDMVDAEASKQTRLTVGRAIFEEKERESEQVFNVEAEKNFFDQLMF